MTKLAVLASAVICLAAPGTSPAATFEFAGKVATVRQALSNQVPDPDQASVGVGGENTNAGLAGVLYYELPVLAAAPTLASLTLTLIFARDGGTAGQVPDLFNVDVYSLGTRSTDALNEPGDYGDGSNCPGPTCPGTLLLDNWWTAGDDSQIGTSKTLDITGVVSAAYIGGAPLNAFLVFALYADEPLGPNNFTTYVFTPEPNTAALVGIALIGLAAARRRNPRQIPPRADA